MSAVWLSHRACAPLKTYLRRRGHKLRLIEDDPRFGPGVSSHADLRLCPVRGKPVFYEGVPLPRYPENAALCAVVLDGLLVHRPDITAPALRAACRALGFREVNVRQGYAKCSCVVVDGGSLITSDPGIYASLSKEPGLSLLKIRPGFVSLPGFPTGFLGGASGRVGDEIVFNGDVAAHPDYPAISDFIRSRGLGVRSFPGIELCDVGSIIETEE